MTNTPSSIRQGDLCFLRAPSRAREALPLLTADVLHRLTRIEVADQRGIIHVKSGDLVEIVAELRGAWRLARLPGLDGVLLIDADCLELYKAATPEADRL